MALQYLDDGGYGDGVIRDVPSWLLKKGEVYDSLNMIYDKPGIARQRGGTTAVFSGSQNSFAESIQFCYSTDASATIEELYACSGNIGDTRVINKTTGIATIVGTITSGSRPGRGVRHFGFVIFPYSTPSLAPFRGSIVMAGSTAAASFTSATAQVFTAGIQQIATTGADVTTNMRAGHIVRATNAGSAIVYWGRVVSVDDATHYTVWPRITTTLTSTAAGVIVAPAFADPSVGGACGASFQNRMLLGNTNDVSVSGTATLVNDRRVYYSVLPTESGASIAFGTVITGASYILLSGQSSLTFNYFDVPGSDPIIGMEPLSDNELLILTSTHPVIFRGNLVTQLSTTAQQVTFDLSEMNVQAGCSSDHSIQRTPRGIMWAGVDGIFLYGGGGGAPINVTTGRMATYWRELARSSTFAIHGSAYIRGHYLVTGTSGGTTFALLCNIATNEVTFAPLSAIDTFACVARPTNPSQVWAARWWTTTPVAFTGGSVIRLESIMDAYSAGTTKTDSDGSVVTFSITSRVLAGDSATQKIQQRATVRYQAAMATAAVTVTAQSRIDAADITSAATRALGSLSNTEVRTITTATNATPIRCTTSVVHGLQTDDFVDINGGLVNTHVNGRWRVTVISTTVFDLLGSSGNGVYTGSSATVKKVTETDFLTSTLDEGQGVSFVIASSGTVNNFELHGLRIAFWERRPVMSA